MGAVSHHSNKKGLEGKSSLELLQTQMFSKLVILNQNVDKGKGSNNVLLIPMELLMELWGGHWQLP